MSQELFKAIDQINYHFGYRTTDLNVLGHTREAAAMIQGAALVAHGGQPEPCFPWDNILRAAKVTELFHPVPGVVTTALFASYFEQIGQDETTILDWLEVIRRTQTTWVHNHVCKYVRFRRGEEPATSTIADIRMANNIIRLTHSIKMMEHYLNGSVQPDIAYIRVTIAGQLKHILEEHETYLTPHPVMHDLQGHYLERLNNQLEEFKRAA